MAVSSEQEVDAFLDAALGGPQPSQPQPTAPVADVDAFLDAALGPTQPPALPPDDPANANAGMWDEAIRRQYEEQSASIPAIGRAIQRGWVRSQMANELEKDKPDAAAVSAMQSQVAKLPPSPQFERAMNDKATAGDSFKAFMSNPHTVLGELMVESLSSLAHQMINKAPARVGVGVAIGAGAGLPAAGIGAGPGAVIGARAGFAESVGASSYALEASDGILKSLEDAGVPMNDPVAMQQAFNDPERMQLARDFAAKKAIPIAVFDTASALLAGNLFGKKAVTGLGKLGQGAVETAAQALFGMGGEAAGQLNQSGGISSPRSVIAEGVAEIPGGAIEVGTGMMFNDAQASAVAEEADRKAQQATAPSPVQFTPDAEQPAQPDVTDSQQSADVGVRQQSPTPEVAPEVTPEVEQPQGPPITVEATVGPLAEGAPAVDIKKLEADIPLGVNRPTAQDQSLRGLDDNAFWDMHKQRARTLDAAEKALDESTNPDEVLLDPKKRADYAKLQDEYSQAELERFRRINLDIHSGHLFENMMQLADGQSRDGWLASDNGQKFSILAEIIANRPADQRSNSTLMQLMREDTDPRITSDPNWREVKGAQMANVREAMKKVAPTIQPPQPVAGEAVAPAVHPNPQLSPASENADPSKNVAATTQPAAAKGDGVVTPAKAAKKVAVEVSAAKIDQSKPVPKAIKDGVIGQLDAAIADVEKNGDKGRQSVTVSIPGDGTFTIFKTKESLEDAKVRLSKLSAPISTRPDIGNVTSRESNKEIENYAIQLERALGLDGAIQNQREQLAQAGKDSKLGEAAARTVQYLEEKAGIAAPKARIKRNLTPNSGAVDLDIINDLADYGKQFYRAGMTFGKWAGQMVAEFGQAVAKYLRRAFDAVVAAYKASDLSSERGSVQVPGKGIPQPKSGKQGTSKFNTRMKESPKVLDATKANMGDGSYDVAEEALSIEAAKRFVDEKGIDGAIKHLQALKESGMIPTPVDFAIGADAIDRAAGMDDDVTQSILGNIVEKIGTPLGQAVNSIKYIGRMTPGGILRMSQDKVREHIGEMQKNPRTKAEADALIQADKEINGPDGLRANLNTLRRDLATQAVTDAQYGGETVQDRLKRRLGDSHTVVAMAVRDAIQKGFNKTEAKNDAVTLMRAAEISESEAKGMAKSMVDNFYAALEQGRSELALNRLTLLAHQNRAINQLLAEMKRGDMTEFEFISQVSQIKKLPALTQKMNDRLKQLGKEFRETNDPVIKTIKAYQIHEVIADLIPASILSKMRSWVYLVNLLFPATAVANVAGNTAGTTQNVGRDAAINGLLDPLVSIVTGERTSVASAREVGIRSLVFAPLGAAVGGLMFGPAGIPAGFAYGATVGAALGLAGGNRFRPYLTPFNDVVRGYRHAAANGIDSQTGRLKEGFTHLRILSKLGSMNKFDTADIKNAHRRMFSNPVLRPLEAAMSISLGGPDRAFWSSQYQATLNNMIRAAKANGEWGGIVTPDMHEAATVDANHAVFQNPNIVSRAIATIRRGMNLEKEFGIGSAIFLFAQVVGSLFWRGFKEWTPLGFITSSYDGMKGILYHASDGRMGTQFDQRAFNKAFAAALVGTGSLYIGGYWLAQMGIITAGTDEDEKVEALRRASGFGKYSINLSAYRRALLSGFMAPQPPQKGDWIIPYDWAQPVAITIAAGAELYQSQESARRKGLKKGVIETPSLVAMSLLSGSKSISESSLLSGIGSFMSAYNNNGRNFLAAGYDTVLGMPTMFIPQVVRKAAQWRDNTIRETRGRNEFMEKMGITEPMAQRAFAQLAVSIPGLSDNYPPRFDLMGKAQERYQYEGNSIVNLLFNRSAVRVFQGDPVLAEISRIVSSTGDTSVVPRDITSRTVVLRGKPYEMTNEQLSAYRFYLGNATSEIMRLMVSAPNFAKLPEEAKVDMLATTIKQVNAAIKVAVLGDDPEKLSRPEQEIFMLIQMMPLARQKPPTKATPPPQ
jgi:hypothetical protein